jgi:hypothetical protein
MAYKSWPVLYWKVNEQHCWVRVFFMIVTMKSMIMCLVTLCRSVEVLSVVSEECHCPSAYLHDVTSCHISTFITSPKFVSRASESYKCTHVVWHPRLKRRIYICFVSVLILWYIHGYRINYRIILALKYLRWRETNMFSVIALIYSNNSCQ